MSQKACGVDPAVDKGLHGRSSNHPCSRRRKIPANDNTARLDAGCGICARPGQGFGEG